MNLPVCCFGERVSHCSKIAQCFAFPYSSQALYSLLHNDPHLW